MSENIEQVLDLKSVEAKLQSTYDAIDEFQKKSEAEIKAAGEASVETKNAVEKLAEKSVEIGDRLQSLEQAQASHFEGAVEEKSIGEQFVETDQFRAFSQNRKGSAQLEVKTAIVNAVPSLVQPLTPGHRLDTVVHAPHRALMIRDVLPVGRTDSNIVWFPKENAWTSNAKVQVGGSPTIVAENVAHGESALTFTSDSEEVKTIGHFIPVSLNALSDSSFLKSYVDYKLMYGLKYKEDTELIVGAGTLGTIKGLYTDRTAYSMDSPLSYTTKLDVLRDAKAQAQANNYMEPDFVILNPADWADIELTKETAGMYVFSHPGGVIPQVIWGMRVVLSNSMGSGTFLVGSSSCAQIWDRQDAAVSISYEDSTNFQKDMATLKATERLALTIYNKTGLIGGSFTVT